MEIRQGSDPAEAAVTSRCERPAPDARGRRSLCRITTTLLAADSVADVASVLSEGLQTILGASVVSVALLGADGRLHDVQPPGVSDEHPRREAGVLTDGAFSFARAAGTGSAIEPRDRGDRRRRLAAPGPSRDAQVVMAVPIVAAGRVLGGVAAVLAADRDVDCDERAMVRTLAHQAGVTLARTARADARRRTAEALERSLLPGVPPRLEGLDVSATYLPATGGSRVGGDWYNILTREDGDIAVAVGDVVGHGVPAATVMGQLRSALEALLLAGHPPARSLELLDRFTEGIDGAQLSTAACVQLDPVSGRITYSSAGHPPPLLIGPDGAAFLSAGVAPALGLSGAARRPVATATAGPGATLLLYTDGLVERRRATIDDGLARLVTAAADLTSAPLPDLVDGVVGRLLGRSQPQDDVAVVAVRMPSTPVAGERPAA